MTQKRVRLGACVLGLFALGQIAGLGCGGDVVQGDCAEAADFTSCVSEGATGDTPGVCLTGSCEPLVPCPSGGCDGEGPRFLLPDTNLRECYGPSPDGTDGTIECPGTPGGPDCATTDYCGEDAQYGWDVDHASSERFTVEGVSGEPVVTDGITELSWHGCAAGQGGDQCGGEATRMDWFDAVAFCEGSDWGAHSDWTLPDSHQLHSIVDFGRTSPALDTSVFVNAPSQFQQEYDQWWIECVWTGTDYAGDSSVAWVMMSNSGDISEGSGTTYHLNDKAANGWEGCYVYCARGGKAPVEHERYVVLAQVAGEPVVADTSTRLMWQGCSAGQQGSDCTPVADMMDWQSSLAFCEGLTWGGFDDWRLPNVRELHSLVDTTRERPAIDDHAFPNTPYYGPITHNNAGQYWSSTARSYNSFALYVAFGTGFSHFYEQPEDRHVRCVRGAVVYGNTIDM
jgi:hypothetical protein